MQRACAASLVAGGETILQNPGHSNDDLAAIGVIKALGARVQPLEDGSIKIISKGIRPDGDAVHCGESGLGIRMFAPVIAMSENPITIYGEGSLLNRPMDFFDQVFPQLGVEIHSNQGKLPLQVKGPLQPKNIEIDGSLSSQFLTGLLIAYSSSHATDVRIRVNDLKSRPYVDLTLKIMRDFGLTVPENKNYQEFYFPAAGHQSSSNQSARIYRVEGDWSGGAFLLVAGAIAGEIRVRGLDIHSTQADKAIMQALQAANASMIINEDEIQIGPGSLKAFEFDATDCPDLFPPLVSLAAYCQGTTHIKGIGRLAHKESNRGLTLQEEFARMSVKISLQDDMMLVEGKTALRSSVVHSRHDHRIAMACAVAGLGAKGEITIEEADAVNKSYPDFYVHLQSLGAKVDIEHSPLRTH